MSILDIRYFFPDLILFETRLFSTLRPCRLAGSSTPEEDVVRVFVDVDLGPEEEGNGNDSTEKDRISLRGDLLTRKKD